jgi:hypothetical protein
MHSDGVIIGAGAVGGSVAFQMAESGPQVTLVDQSFPGGGASRATQAGIGVYPKKPRPNLELNLKGAELYPSLAARLQRDAELRMDGALNQTFAVRPRPLSLIIDDTVICRCEEITAGELVRTRADWARTLDAVRTVTRAGFGRSQGTTRRPRPPNCSRATPAPVSPRWAISIFARRPSPSPLMRWQICSRQAPPARRSNEGTRLTRKYTGRPGPSPALAGRRRWQRRCPWRRCRWGCRRCSGSPRLAPASCRPRPRRWWHRSSSP